MILAPWTGEGSLDPATVAATAAAEREGWAALRSLQGDRAVDVVRYARTAGDPSRGVPAAKTLVPGLTGLPALLGDVTAEEAEVRGVAMEQGLTAFELFADLEVLLTDLLRLDGAVYAVVRSYWEPVLGQCVVWARPAPGSA